MRLVVGLSFLLLAYFCYQELFVSEVDALDGRELESLLKSDSAESRKLKASFNQILPQVDKKEFKPDALHVSSPRKVESTPAEAIEHFQDLMEDNQYEAMTYLRWVLFTSQFSGEEKDEVFAGALPLVSREEVISLSRVIVARNSEPPVLRRALSLSIQDMEHAAAETFLKNLYLQSDFPELRNVIKDFANSQGYTF